MIRSRVGRDRIAPGSRLAGKRAAAAGLDAQGEHYAEERDGDLLEPHRPPEAQRPLITALPAVPDLRGTIDGEAADTWIQRPGAHHVVVARGTATDAVDAVDIVYE